MPEKKYPNTGKFEKLFSKLPKWSDCSCICKPGFLKLVLLLSWCQNNQERKNHWNGMIIKGYQIFQFEMVSNFHTFARFFISVVQPRNGHKSWPLPVASSPIWPWQRPESHWTPCTLLHRISRGTKNPFLLQPQLQQDWTSMELFACNQEERTTVGEKVILQCSFLAKSFLPARLLFREREREGLYLLGKSESTQEVFDRRHLISSTVGVVFNRWWLSTSLWPAFCGKVVRTVNWWCEVTRTLNFVGSGLFFFAFFFLLTFYRTRYLLSRDIHVFCPLHLGTLYFAQTSQGKNYWTENVVQMLLLHEEF